MKKALSQAQASPPQTNDKQALLRGLAKWRLALTDHAPTDEAQAHHFSLTQEQLDKTYLCVDTDVVTMFTQPAQGAGYLGLHDYGAAYHAHEAERASAAALSSGLARFILFDMRCALKSDEPRLMLPGHAQEIGRKYEATSRQATSQINAAIGELKELQALADSIRENLQGTTHTAANEEELHDALQKFINRWFGQSNATPTGLAALAAQTNFSDLFNPPAAHDESNDGERRHGTRLLNITQHKFQDAFAQTQGYAPELAIPTSQKFNDLFVTIADLEQIDDRHRDRKTQEIQDDLDADSTGFNNRTLKRATDAYSFAWLQAMHHEADKGDWSCRVVSGAQNPAGVGPEFAAWHPMRFVRLYLEHATKQSNPQAVDELKRALNAALEPVHMKLSVEVSAPQDFVLWCQRIANGEDQNAIESDSEHLDSEAWKDVQTAWQRVCNLVTAADSPGGTGQGLYAIVRDYSNSKWTLTSEQWIKKLSAALTSALIKLGFESSELAFDQLTDANSNAQKIARHPPPLLLDSFEKEGIREICETTIWELSAPKTQPQPATNAKTSPKDKIKAVFKKVENIPYIFQLLGGLAFASRGRWRPARLCFEAAGAAATVARRDQRITGEEAAYALAVAQRVTADTIADLEASTQSLELARQRWVATDVRYESERLSMQLTRSLHWLAHPPANKAVDTAQKIANQCLPEAYSNLHEVLSDADLKPHIKHYVQHAAACCVIQFFALKRWGLYVDQVFSYAEVVTNNEEESWLASAVKALPNSTEVNCHHSQLVALNRQLGSLLQGNKISNQEKELFLEQCEDSRNHVIPLVDGTRMRYFSQLMKRLTGC